MDSVQQELDGWLGQMQLRHVDRQVEAARQRIGRLARLFTRVLDEAAADQGISVGDLEALSVLARTPPPCTPTRLAAALRLTSGTVSARLNRLTASGLVEVMPATDARSRPVRLTRAGRARWRAATAARTAYEHELFSALSATQLARLNPALAALLRSYEDRFGAAPRHDRAGGAS